MFHNSYDPEATFQDADVETWEMNQVGAAMLQAQKAGRCCHNSAVGYIPKPVFPEQEGLKPGQLRCTDGCGILFESDEDWINAMRYALEV